MSLPRPVWREGTRGWVHGRGALVSRRSPKSDECPPVCCCYYCEGVDGELRELVARVIQENGLKCFAIMRASERASEEGRKEGRKEGRRGVSGSPGVHVQGKALHYVYPQLCVLVQFRPAVPDFAVDDGGGRRRRRRWCEMM